MEKKKKTKKTEANNNKIEEFAKLITACGLSDVEAYKAVYPEKCLGKTEHYITNYAHAHKKSKAVQEYVKLFQKAQETAFKKIVSRESLLDDVSRLIDDCKNNLYTNTEDNIYPLFDTKVASVLVKAIERAAKMIGADEPEKVQSEVIVTFDKEFDKYAK